MPLIEFRVEFTFTDGNTKNEKSLSQLLSVNVAWRICASRYQHIWYSYAKPPERVTHICGPRDFQLWVSETKIGWVLCGVLMKGEFSVGCYWRVSSLWGVTEGWVFCGVLLKGEFTVGVTEGWVHCGCYWRVSSLWVLLMGEFPVGCYSWVSSLWGVTQGWVLCGCYWWVSSLWGVTEHLTVSQFSGGFR